MGCSHFDNRRYWHVLPVYVIWVKFVSVDQLGSELGLLFLNDQIFLVAKSAKSARALDEFI